MSNKLQRPETHPFITHLLIILGYSLLALLFTYPLGAHLNSYVVGLEVDAEEYLWSFWWMRKAVLELGTNPYYTTWLYYPTGVSLYFFASSPLHAFLSIPFQELFGLIVAYNLIGLLAFIFSAYTAYLLAYDISKHRLASIAAGALFAFAPTQIFHLEVGQPNLNAVEFIPLYIFCLRRWLQGGSLRFLLGAAIGLTLSSLNDWQFGVYCELFTGVLLIAEWFARRSEWKKAFIDLFWRTAVMQLIFLITVLPIVIPMLNELGGPEPYMVRKRTDTVYHSADLFAFLVPNPMHPLWRDWAEPLRLSIQEEGVTVTVVSLSYVAMVISFFALRWRWKESRFWFFSGLIFLILAMGPELLVLGYNTGILLPYEALFQLPIIRISRAPARYVVITILCLAVLLAIGLKEILERLASRRALSAPNAQLVPWAIIFFLLCFELLPAPVDAYEPAQAPAFFTDGTLDNAGALLEVPNPSNRGMYFALVHNHPVMYGELSRDNPPGALLAHLREAYKLDDIMAEQNGPSCLYRSFNITHLVLYPNPQEDPQNLRQQEIETHLPPEQFLVSDTPQGRLYRLPENPSNETCVLLGKGWQGARQPEPGRPLHRWTGQTALLGLYRTEPGRVELSFTINSFAIPRQVEVTNGDTHIRTLYVGEPARESIELDLPAGITWLQFHSLEPALDPKEYGYREEAFLALGFEDILVENR